MAKKIEIIDNALIVTDTISSKIEVSEPAKDYWYKESDLQIGRITFFDANGLKGEEQITIPFINLTDAVDSGLTPFSEATFRDFCTANLGKSSPTVEGTLLTEESFKEKSPELAGAFYINNLTDLEAAALPVTPSEIKLKEGIKHVFNAIVNIGTKVLNINGASLSASTPAAAGVQSNGSTVLKSVDRSVFVDEGFLVLGDPSGSTSCLDFTNPSNTRNFLAFKGICQFNNSRSIINGFQNMLFSGNMSDSTEGYELDLVNAVSLKFQTLDIGSDMTATDAFKSMNEGTADLAIEITACNVRPSSGKVSFNINNTTKAAGFINVSGNTSLGDGEILSGASPVDDNVLSQGNTGLMDTIITGETGYNSVAGIVTPQTQNVWSAITGTMNFKPNTALGIAQNVNGVLEVTRPVKNQRIRVRCQISGDNSGSSERVSGIRLSKSTDGIIWNELDDGVNFTTRITADSVCYETVDVANQGDKYRLEVVNKENNSDINIYAVRMQIL